MNLLIELLGLSEGIDSGDARDGKCPECDRPIGLEGLKANKKLCSICEKLADEADNG